jgi:oxalate decarboxylase/phosphoglucose isomerase-like protein (cupin superfamily)
VSGTGEFRLGNATVKGGPGFHVFGPRGVSHTYRNVGDTDLKVLIVYSPGGFEQSFLDIDAMGETATDPRATGIVMQAYGVTRV